MIVEDGSIVAGADSYVSVEAADAYATSRGLAAWLALAVELKEPALIRATDHLERKYASRWKGCLVAPATQPLAWPRKEVPARAPGVDLAADAVPTFLKQACIELAVRSASGTDLSPDAGRTVLREKVDVIEVEYSEHGRQVLEFTTVEHLVEPYVRPKIAGALKLVRY